MAQKKNTIKVVFISIAAVLVVSIGIVLYIIYMIRSKTDDSTNDGSTNDDTTNDDTTGDDTTGDDTTGDDANDNDDDPNDGIDPADSDSDSDFHLSDFDGDSDGSGSSAPGYYSPGDSARSFTLRIENRTGATEHINLYEVEATINGALVNFTNPRFPNGAWPYRDAENCFDHNTTDTLMTNLCHTSDTNLAEARLLADFEANLDDEMQVTLYNRVDNGVDRIANYQLRITESGDSDALDGLGDGGNVATTQVITMTDAGATETFNFILGDVEGINPADSDSDSEFQLDGTTDDDTTCEEEADLNNLYPVNMCPGYTSGDDYTTEAKAGFYDRAEDRLLDDIGLDAATASQYSGGTWNEDALRDSAVSECDTRENCAVFSIEYTDDEANIYLYREGGVFQPTCHNETRRSYFKCEGTNQFPEVYQNCDSVNVLEDPDCDACHEKTKKSQRKITNGEIEHEFNYFMTYEQCANLCYDYGSNCDGYTLKYISLVPLRTRCRLYTITGGYEAFTFDTSGAHMSGPPCEALAD